MNSRPIALALVLTLATSGCVSVEMGRIKRDIERDVERDGTAEVGDGFAMAFGRGTIGTTRFLGRLVAPASTEPYRLLSRNVRQVKVARYPIDGTFDGRSVRRPATLDRFEADGWVNMVTVRDTASAVWVLYRERPDNLRLTDLLTVVVAEHDLVLTRVSGDLSQLVLDAVQAGSVGGLFGGAFDETGMFGWPDDALEEAPDRNETTDTSP